MTNKTRAATVLIFVCFTAIGLTLGFNRRSSTVPPVDPASVGSPVTAPQECAKCEGKCKPWIDKCKEGGQYACYKASACLCKCNLDAGGCGSSKKALKECYEQNEKLAKELGPSGDWQVIGSCGGVDFLASVAVDDGRNDSELKLKVDNKNVHAIQTRLNAVVESAAGQKKSRDNVGTGRVNGKRATESCSTTPSLCFGVLFPSGVAQKEAAAIAKITLTKVEVANIDAPPAHASPEKYLEPFREFPTTRCRGLSIAFDTGSTPAFVKLTDRCVKTLPKWTKPDCDDAVDEIIKAYTRATTIANQNCIKEWRAYQKCYEVYAYDSNPTPRRECQRPKCKVKEVSL